MKRVVLTLIMVLIVALSFGASKPNGAIIEIKDTTHNFGEVSRKGDDVRHTFTIRNAGSAPLVITEVSTTCTCIKAKYPKRPIPPQGSAAVEIEYEVQRKEVGPFYKVIKILSNSTNGDQILTINGVSTENK